MAGLMMACAEKPVKPMPDGPIYKISDLKNLTDQFDLSLLSKFKAWRRDCIPPSIDIVDLTYMNVVSISSTSQGSLLAFPIESYDNNSFEIKWSGKVIYQYDTAKNVLLKTYKKSGKQFIYYFCDYDALYPIIQNQYKQYLKEQKNLSSHVRKGRNRHNSARFLEGECRRYHVRRQSKKALPMCLQALAKRESGIANYYIGRIYSYPIDGVLDQKVGFNYTSKAAQLGYIESYSWLGWHYRFGHGVEVDQKEALRWFQKSFDEGIERSAMSIAQLNFHGDESIRNRQEGAKWYLIAAKQGNDFAQNRVGALYFRGYILEQDYQQAFDWLTLSVNQRNLLATFNLATLYDLGLGVEKDQDYANYLFSKVTKMGINKMSDIQEPYDRLWHEGDN